MGSTFGMGSSRLAFPADLSEGNDPEKGQKEFDASVLQAARCTGSQHLPQKQRQIAGCRLAQQLLLHLRLPAHVPPPPPARLEQVSKRALQHLAPFPQQRLPSEPLNPSPIAVHQHHH